SVPLGESKCDGITEVLDPAGDQKAAPANADLDVMEVRAADNVIGGKEKIAFKMKVSNLGSQGSALLPNRNWRILWNYPIPCATCDPVTEGGTPFTGSYYVGMNTDASSMVSFEFGTVTTIESVPANTATPNKMGAAEVESNID